MTTPIITRESSPQHYAGILEIIREQQDVFKTVSRRRFVQVPNPYRQSYQGTTCEVRYTRCKLITYRLACGHLVRVQASPCARPQTLGTSLRCPECSHRAAVSALDLPS